MHLPKTNVAEFVAGCWRRRLKARKSTSGSSNKKNPEFMFAFKLRTTRGRRLLRARAPAQSISIIRDRSRRRHSVADFPEPCASENIRL
jgi:hypothetical protein